MDGVNAEVIHLKEDQNFGNGPIISAPIAPLKV